MCPLPLCTVTAAQNASNAKNDETQVICDGCVVVGETENH